MNSLLDQLRTAFDELHTDSPWRVWHKLRKALEALPVLQLSNVGVTPTQLGALYMLRALVGDVEYNVLHGDSPRHKPVEEADLSRFRELTDRVRMAVASAISSPAETSPLSTLGEAVILLEQLVHAIDGRAKGAGVSNEGAGHG